MALDVRYGEIRTNVIEKLNEQFQEMESIYQKMNLVVNGIAENKYMVGKTAEGYIEEFTQPISEIFTKLNQNIDNYCMQLSSMCDEYEKQDAEMSAALQ